MNYDEYVKFLVGSSFCNFDAIAPVSACPNQVLPPLDSKGVDSPESMERMMVKYLGENWKEL